MSPVVHTCTAACLASACQHDNGLLDHRNQAQSLPRSYRSASNSMPSISPGPRTNQESHALTADMRGRGIIDLDTAELHSARNSNDFAIEDDLQFGLDEDITSHIEKPAGNARPRAGSHLDDVLSAPLRSPRVTYEVNNCPPSLELDQMLHRTLSTSSAKPQQLTRNRRSSNNHRDGEEDRSSIDAPSHPDSQDGEVEEAEQDVCFPMSEEYRSAEGIDFDELDAFVAEQSTQATRHISRDDRRLSIVSKLGSNIEVCEKPIQSSGSTTDTDPRLSSINDRSSTTATHRDYSSRFASPALAPMRTHHLSVPDLIPEVPQLMSNLNNSSSRPLTANHLRQMERGQNAPDRFSFFTSERDDTVHAPDLGGLLESSGSFKKLFRQDRGCWWLDVMCPTDGEMKLLAKAFGIHPLTAEDIRVQEAREKVELFKSYYFVCFKSFDHDKDSEDFLEPVNIYVVVFKEGLLSFHFAPTSHPANVRRRIRQLRDYVSVSADWISYAIIDDVTDVFMPLIHEIELETDSIEDAVMITRESDTGDMLRRIGECRKKVMALYRLLHGKADVIKMFAKRCNEQWDVAPKGEIGLYLGDIQDHLVTMTSSLTQFEKILSRSHSNYLAQLSIHSMESNNRLNAVLGKITFIATMLVPMNLLTGLFGMSPTLIHV